MPPAERIVIGESLSQYRVLSKLGAGGMGEVYLAEDQNLKRKVALKVMPPEMAEDPERLMRFRREAEMVAALNHPNIVTIHNIEEIAGKRILVMELVEGKSLDRILSPGGLPLQEALAISVQLTNALVAAHEKGIVHRDLKPANIMIRPDGQVKVLDFGLAKIATQDLGLLGEDDATQAATQAADLTREGTVMGTAPYMSPEQLKGEAVDHRTDIFSFGIVLYEMVTGRRPFHGESGIEVASRILRDKPPSACDVRQDLPQLLGSVIHTCLEKDPEQRYPSMFEVRNELERLGSGVDSGAALPPLSARGVASGPVGSEAPTLISDHPAAGSSGPSMPMTSSGRWRWLGLTMAVLVLLASGVWWLGRDHPPSLKPDGGLGRGAFEKIAVLPFATRGTGPIPVRGGRARIPGDL